jgi:hypothetical protein
LQPKRQRNGEEEQEKEPRLEMTEGRQKASMKLIPEFILILSVFLGRRRGAEDGR